MDFTPRLNSTSYSIVVGQPSGKRLYALIQSRFEWFHL
jgi:hypothetical protein